MDIQLTGRVIKIGQTQKFTKFQKREFVLEVSENPNYPETLSIEVVQDKCDSLDHMKIGDTLTAHVNLKGRKWQNPEGEFIYFNTIQCWRFDKGEAAPKDSGASSFEDDGDGLPF